MRSLLLLVVIAAACTASKAQVRVVSAEEALRRAEEYDADEKAVYEYTMAVEYLAKAKDELGHSQTRMADALARQSAEWSDRAIIFVERRGRKEINAEGLSDEAPPPPPPPPDPDPDPAPVDPELEEILAPSPAPAPENPDDDIELPE
jgi:hypothetical protein